ncbi:MAG: dTMP kinase [Pseudonocardiaceae bacterium]
MGVFCVLEGVDGTGKSHLAKAICKHVDELGLTNTVVAPKDDPIELSSFWANDRLRRMHRLTWSYDHEEPVWTYSRQYWLFSLLAWYTLFHEQYVAPQLAAGRTVVTDGWYFKHQARFHLSGDEQFKTLADYTLRTLPQPDVVILLDAPLTQIAERKEGMSKPSEHGAFDKGVRVADGGSFLDYQHRSHVALRQILEKHPSVLCTFTAPSEPEAVVAALATLQSGSQ